MLQPPPLNHKQFLRQLQAVSLPPELSPVPASAFMVHGFETVASTNAEVWRLLAAGAGEGVVAIAHHQQQGRGQRGRLWHSPPGGLYLSLGLTPNLPTDAAVQLTLGCAGGIAAALRAYRVPVGVKWLNDLVLAGRKLGGILTETRIQGGRIRQAVVGIGINWQNSVPDLGIALAAWLHRQPQASIPSLEMLGAIALQGAFAGYRLGQAGDRAALVAHYDSVLVNRGQLISLSPLYSAASPLTGTILGVNSTGALRVQPHPTPATELYIPPGTLQLGYPTPHLPLESRG